MVRLWRDFNTCSITNCQHYHTIIITCMSSSLSDVDHIVRRSPSRHPSSAFCRCAPPLFPPPDIFMLSDHISPPPTSRISYIISHKKPFPRDHCVIVFLNPSKLYKRKWGVKEGLKICFLAAALQSHKEFPKRFPWCQIFKSRNSAIFICQKVVETDRPFCIRPAD